MENSIENVIDAIKDYVKEKLNQTYPTPFDDSEFFGRIKEAVDEVIEEYEEERDGLITDIKSEIENLSLEALDRIKSEL